MKSAAVTTAILSVFLAAPPPASGATVVYRAPEETARLSPGPNLKDAEDYCGVCHSYEYITTQPRGPGFGRDFWQAEVAKMIKVFGAQIKDDEAKAIVDYLSNTYR